jgi:hypothetical protein
VVTLPLDLDVLLHPGPGHRPARGRQDYRQSSRRPNLTDWTGSGGERSRRPRLWAAPVEQDQRQRQEDHEGQPKRDAEEPGPVKDPADDLENAERDECPQDQPDPPVPPHACRRMWPGCGTASIEAPSSTARCDVGTAAATVALIVDLGESVSAGRTGWARLGSNQRPLACKASALPLSYAPRDSPESTGSPPSPRRAVPAPCATRPGPGPDPARSSPRTAPRRPGRSGTYPGWRSPVRR